MEKLRNRLFACGTAAFILMNGIPLQTAHTAFAAELTAAARGDVNGDGKKNSDDLDALTKLLGEHVETLFSEEQYVQYDITQDGIIDVRDRYALSQYLSGIATELPVKPSSDLDEEVTLSLKNAVCFPGDDFQVALSFVDWNKDIAAYDITIGFDTALKFKEAKFISGEGQVVAGNRTVKLSELYPNDPLRRGDIAVLTFTAPDQDGDFQFQVEGANVFSSGYGIYKSEKPAASVTVQPLYEPVALHAAGIGSKSVSLEWKTPVTDQPVMSYRVYRGGKLIGDTSDTAYTDTKLTEDTDYEYTVSAVMENGVETAQSQPLNVHTAAPKILSTDFQADTVSDANSDLTVKLSQAVPLSEMKLDIKGADGKTVSESVKLDGENLSAISYHLDVSKLADGNYTLTVTVVDSDGTAASAETAFSVLNNPLKPLTLEGAAGGRTAVLTWNLAAEAAVTGYLVYRLKADGKTWEQIAEVSGRNTLSYTDCSLTAGTKYTYAVTSTDSFGQESEKSNSVTVTPDADKTAPEITIFKPEGGLHVSGDLPVSISASDENGVKTIRCEISADDGKTWKTLCEAEGDSADWTIQTAGHKDGVYKLRAMAVDADGNTSSGTNVISVVFDNTAPEQVKNIRIVSVSPNEATIAWDNVADEDFDRFVAIISDKNDTSERIVKDTLGLTLYNLIPDTRYTVTVYAVDAAGNAGEPSETFRFVSTSDVTPPTITEFGVSSEYASANATLIINVSASDPSGISYRYLDYSQDKKTWKTLSVYGLYDYRNRRIDFELNDSTLKTGELYLRAYAQDNYGNKGDPETAQIHTLTVDNDPPKAPTKFTAVANQNANAFSWTASASEDVIGYQLERAVGKEDASYSVIADRINELTFTDKAVVPDGEYYYRLYAIDRAGNKSAAAKSGMVKRTPDTEKPVITECGLSTGDRIVCSAHRTLQIMATDNNRIETISAAYRCKESAAWTALETTETTENSIRTELIVRTELPESILTESSVTVQVTAADAAGNAAVSEYTFPIDDRKAKIIDAAATIGEKQVNVIWTCKDVSAVSRFQVVRRIGTAGTDKHIAYVEAGDSTAFEAADTDLTTGGSYIYTIIAYMTNGNIVSLKLDPITVQAIPHAELDFTPAQIVGKEYSFDARESRNADDITEVRISFGDGVTAEKKSVQNAVFTHTYKKAGTYEVVLTVSNASGISDTKTVTVTAAEPDIMSTVIASVNNMDGSPAAGVSVYVDVGTDQQSKYTTNAEGKVQFDCTAGEHEFGVFASGYLPATKIETLQPNGQKEIRFAITKDELVKADFTVERMSLEEVKAAGINVKDPENCQMVKIDVELKYSITSTVTDHIRIYYDRSSGSYSVSDGSGGGGSGGGGGGGGSGSGSDGSGSSNYNYYIKAISYDVNTVVMMRVPVKTQFIKEFFKVDMIVMNNASAGFPLTDCTAALHLPDGLSLMENTPASEPRTASFGTIGGGEQKTISWIVRGDRNGDYNFSADFNGTLQPFKEPVSLTFSSKDPIHVYGQEAAKITVTFDPVIAGKTLFAEVLVENESPIDLNDLSTDIGKVISDTVGTDKDGNPHAVVYQTRFTGTDGVLKIIDDSKKISVLHPGEKFSVVYAIRGIIGETIPGVYRKTQSEISKNSTSKNVKVQVAHIKIANVNDPLYGIAFDPEKDFLFRVTNKKGQAISGAEIVLKKAGSDSGDVIKRGTTDDRGRLVVPRGDAALTYQVEINAEGYAEYSENFRFSTRKGIYMETFVLGGDYDDNDFSLIYCLFQEENIGSIGLLSRSYTVSRGDDITFSILASVATAGATYELIQGSRVIRSQNASGRTMAFMELTPDMFQADVPVKIRITASEGDQFETEIGLYFVDPAADMSNNEDIADLIRKIVEEFGENSTFNIPAPAVLGEWGSNMDLTIKLPDFTMIDLDKPINKVDAITFQYTVSDGKPSITFGISNEKKLDIGLLSFAFKISVTLGGELDPQANTANLTGSVSVELSGEIGKDFPIPPAPYLFVKISFGAGGEAHASLQYTHHFDDPLNGTLSYEVGGGVYLALTPEFGVGSSGYLSASVYGTGQLDVKGTFLKSDGPGQLDEVYLSGKIGIKAEVMNQELINFAFFNSPKLYFVNNKAGRPRLLKPDGGLVEDEIRDPSVYRSFTAEEIPQAGAWNGHFGDSITEMQTGISAGSAPVIVSDGSRAVMVWIVKEIERGLHNAPKAVYSVYDPETKVWSEPAAVDDNGNADTDPVLFAGADGIRIAYMESAKVYEDGESKDLTEFAKQLVFKTAKFDAESGKFTDFRTIEANADGGFATTPEFAQAADGTTYLFWMKNANGLIFGTDDSNMILCAKETEDGWDTPAILAEQLPEITGFTTGTDAAGNPVCAYVTSKTDEDGAIANTLYTADLSGKVTELASGDIAAPQFTEIPGKGASGLVWYQDGGLSASVDFATAEVLCDVQSGITDRFAVAGDRVLFLRNTENRAEVFSIRFDAEAGGFTAPVSIEAGENLYYETLSVAKSGDATLYAMRRTEATFNEEGDLDTASALTGGILAETADIRIAELEYNYPDAQAGQAFPINVTVFNDGSAAENEFTLHISDAAGKELVSDTKNQVIASGASETIAFAPVLPAELAPALYTVYVTANEADKTPDNNKADLDLTRTDLEITTDITYFGDTTRVTIFATNLSNVPSAAVIHIHPTSAEEETLTLFTDEIASHSSAYWQLDSVDMLGDIYRDFVNITAESEIADADENNNNSCVIISKSGMDPYSAGDVDLNGKVELEDAMLALKCYTRSVAKLKNLGFSNTQMRCADVDRDGFVDVTDSMEILKYYVNNIAGNYTGSFTEYLAQQQNGGAKHESE